MLHHSYRSLAFIAVLLTSLGVDAAHAQETGATRLAQTLSPLVNNQTLLVAHVDLTKLQPAEAFDQLADLLKLSSHDREASASLARPWTETAKALSQAGAGDLFVLLSMEDLPAGDFVTVVPIRTGVDQATVEKQLTIAPHYGEVGAAAHRVGDLLVVAQPRELANVKKLSPAARPELAAALAAVEGSTAQIVLMPSAETRRAIEEIMPMLPKEIGGTASRVFTQGAQWIVAGLDLPPQKLDARLVIQSASAEAAAALNAELPRLLQTLGQLPIVQSSVPKFAEFAGELRPTVAGDRLTLQRSSVTALASLLTPPLEIGRLQTARARSMNNLKQIMLAMFNYLDASKTSAFPPRTSYSVDGKPLLSWRVQLLPYLDQKELFKEFHLDEPWDSQHNRQLIERMPDVYHSPLSRAAPAGRRTSCRWSIRESSRAARR